MHLNIYIHRGHLCVFLQKKTCLLTWLYIVYLHSINSKQFLFAMANCLKRINYLNKIMFTYMYIIIT